MTANDRRRCRRANVVLEVLEPRVLMTTVPAYTFEAVATFSSRAIGAHAQGLVMDAQGNLFGVTSTGGTKDYGTIFELPANSSTIIKIADFTGGNGISPHGNLVLDSAGNLFGVTVGGGEFNKGTIFELPVGSGTITTLASFDGVNGSYPIAGLIMDGSGNLFGEAMGATKKKFASTVWELATGSSTITALATFKGSDKLNSTLVVNSSGDVFGTTSAGGSAKRGSIFEIAAGSGTGTTLASFKGTNSGASPRGTLLVDSDGNLIGMTANGGTKGFGTIFKLTISGTTSTLSTLANFGEKDGHRPLGTLVVDDAGDIFGVTALGGSKSVGTVFELPVDSGTVTTLFTFKNQSTGGNPTGALVLGPDGTLWGATYLGGTLNSGRLFKLTPD